MPEIIDVEKITITYYEDVYKFCCARCRDADVAQDITQDTFLFLVNNKDKLVNNNIRSWLLAVANNKLHEYFRKNSIENNYVCIDDVNIPIFDNYDYQNINIDEIFDDVQKKILNLLNEKEKDLFIRLYIEKCSVSLIKTELNITDENFRARKSRLNKKVRDIIKHTDFLLLVLSFKFFN